MSGSVEMDIHDRDGGSFQEFDFHQVADADVREPVLISLAEVLGIEAILHMEAACAVAPVDSAAGAPCFQVLVPCISDGCPCIRCTLPPTPQALFLALQPLF